MYIPRLFGARLRSLARSFPALVLSGARQSGKTTLMGQTFSAYHRVSLDLPSRAEQAERDPSSFFRDNPPPLCVDEVQYAPGLFRHIKAEIDKDRHAMGRFILTGSHSFNLMKGVSESLAGRAAIIELENLAEAELVAVGLVGTGGQDRLRLLARGQFPELWRDPSIPAREFYAAYVATYLERDVRQILNVTSLRDFERFIRILAARSGTILNKSEVAKDVGVSVKAIGDWISVLQASGQIVLLEPWFANFGKRIVKSPKLYFRDSGLLCFLLGLDAGSLESSPFLGAIWETFLFGELRKLEAATGSGTRFWFYRDQRAREIDFVLERGGRLSFVEAKWTEHPDDTDIRVITAISRELTESGGPWRAGPHYVLSRSAEAYPLAEGISAVNETAIGTMLATDSAVNPRGSADPGR